MCEQFDEQHPRVSQWRADIIGCGWVQGLAVLEAARLWLLQGESPASADVLRACVRATLHADSCPECGCTTRRERHLMEGGARIQITRCSNCEWEMEMRHEDQ